MATKSVVEIFTALKERIHSLVKTMEPPEKVKMPWPGQDEIYWPQPDILIRLNNGSEVVVEIDDHGDPVRSITKYWPLIHAINSGLYQYPSITLIEVFQPDSTYGRGFGILAEFVGKRLSEQYKDVFQFHIIHRQGKSARDIALEIERIIEALL